MLCDHLEGWDGEGGREGDARGKRNVLKKKIQNVKKGTRTHRHLLVGKLFFLATVFSY